MISKTWRTTQYWRRPRPRTWWGWSQPRDSASRMRLRAHWLVILRAVSTRRTVTKGLAKISGTTSPISERKDAAAVMYSRRTRTGALTIDIAADEPNGAAMSTGTLAASRRVRAQDRHEKLRHRDDRNLACPSSCSDEFLSVRCFDDDAVHAWDIAADVDAVGTWAVGGHAAGGVGGRATGHKDGWGWTCPTT